MLSGGDVHRERTEFLHVSRDQSERLARGAFVASVLSLKHETARLGLMPEHVDDFADGHLGVPQFAQFARGT